MIAALLLPSPRASGISLSTCKLQPSSFFPRNSAIDFATRMIKFDSSRGTLFEPSPVGNTSNQFPRFSTETFRYSESARPQVSKLAPRLEVEAGTVISVLPIVRICMVSLVLSGHSYDFDHPVVYQTVACDDFGFIA